MRRVQICIEESLDDILQVEAAKRNCSNAELIRECVSARYGNNLQIDRDPLRALIGFVDIASAGVDDVVYGD